MNIDEALQWSDGYVATSTDSKSLKVLADEVRRLRSLFGSFQLECCDDWTCAEEHARNGAAALHEARAEVERLRAELDRHTRELTAEQTLCAALDEEAKHLRTELAGKEHDRVSNFAIEQSLRAENAALRAENAALKTEARTRDAEHASLLEAQIKRLEREYQEAQNGFNDHVALCKQLQAENAELRAAIVDYFAAPSSEKKRAIRSKYGLPEPARRTVNCQDCLEHIEGKCERHR